MGKLASLKPFAQMCHSLTSTCFEMYLLTAASRKLQGVSSAISKFGIKAEAQGGEQLYQPELSCSEWELEGVGSRTSRLTREE